MRTFVFLSNLLIPFLFLNILYAQHAVLNGIVEVKTRDEDNNLGASGTGIIVGQSGLDLIIITAHHVVEVASSATIKLNGLGQTRYSARIHRNFDEDLDLAVLIAEIPFSIAFDFYKFRQSNMERVKVQGSVIAVGYPFAGISVPLLKPNDLDNMDPDGQGNKISFSAIGVQQGYLRLSKQTKIDPWPVVFLFLLPLMIRG